MIDRTGITAPAIISAISRVHRVVRANEEYLNELDAVVGDGEHGLNLRRAFDRVNNKLSATEVEKPGEALRVIGFELVASGGGAGATLYGTAFMAGAKVADEVDVIDLSILSEVFDEALGDILDRGRAMLGDKTLVDALSPAADAVRAEAQAGSSPKEALASAAQAARNGAIATKEMEGRKGRSVYAGERALGVPDPGATSTYLVLAALADQPCRVPL